MGVAGGDGDRHGDEEVWLFHLQPQLQGEAGMEHSGAWEGYALSMKEKKWENLTIRLLPFIEIWAQLMPEQAMGWLPLRVWD